MEIAALITSIRNAANAPFRSSQFYSDLSEALTGLNLGISTLASQIAKLPTTPNTTANTGAPESTDLSFLDVPYAATLDPSWQSNNQIIRIICTGNLTLNFPTNMSNGRRLRFCLESDGFIRNVTFGSSWYNAPAALSPLVLAANTNTYIEFVQLDLTNARCTSLVRDHLN